MTASTLEPTTVPTTLAGDLLLARLLPPTKRPPAPARVRDDVSRFFREHLSDERWQATLDGLVRAGLLAVRPMRLTEAGRTRALDFLGVGELPSRCTWGTIQVRFLLPKALGFAPNAPESLKKMGKEENLAALLLKRRFELAVGQNPTLGKAFEALVCRELGFPQAAALAEVKTLVLSRLIGSEERLGAKELRKKMPRVLLGANKGGLAGLREVVLRGWADRAAAQPAPVRLPEARIADEKALEEPTPAEFDLSAFAQTVKAAARDCPTGLFGDNKVFISHVWRRLRDEPGFPAMDLSTFKQWLTEANNARLVTLSRADLVQVMDATDVRESETRYLNAEFHFVLLEKEQP